MMSVVLGGQPRSVSDEQAPATAASPSTDATSPAAAPIPDDVAKPLVDLFKLLADETRLRILFLLQQRRELHVRALCQLLKQSQPAVSHHLALLRAAGLIEMRRDGKHNFYHLLPARFEQMVGSLFASAPGAPNQIRFQDYVLSYSQAVQPA
jgi:ArsR family transcriptional regulator